MASEEAFSRVLRGYDPAEVDPLIQKLRRELLGAKTLHDETISELKDLEARYAELQLDADVKSTPTVAGLSAKLNAKLKKADTVAAEIVRRAESDALFIRSAAEKTSSQFIEAARDDYEQARADAQVMVGELIGNARAQAEQIIKDAQAQAQEILDSGQEEGQRLRGEAATLAANLRAETRNTVANLTAQAQREAEELKLVLVTNRDPAVDINDNIVRMLKLNADNAAVRAEMENELQVRHQEAVLQTEKYIGAAEAQLATARTRLRAIESVLESREREAQLEAETLIEQARKAAAKESHSTAKLARKKVTDAEKYVAAVLTSIYAQLEGIRVEREAVAEFFDALRLELQHSLGDAASTHKLDR